MKWDLWSLLRIRNLRKFIYLAFAIAKRQILVHRSSFRYHLSFERFNNFKKLITRKNLIKNPLWSPDRNSWKITRKWKSQGQAHCCYFRNWRVSNREIIFSQLLNSISHASRKWKRNLGVARGRKWGTHRVYMA